MKQLIFTTIALITLMLVGCTQTNKSTTISKQETKEVVEQETKKKFPEVTATPGKTDQPTATTETAKDAQSSNNTNSAQSPENPTKNAQSSNTTAKDAQSPENPNDPDAYTMKDKDETTTASSNKEKNVQEGNDFQGPKAFLLNERFGLRLNETAVNNEIETGVEVLAIRDNRCPVGVNCFRAGEVEVDLKINGKETTTLTFPTAEKPGSTSYYASGLYGVKLLGASRKGRPDLTKQGGGLLNNFSGIEVYLQVDKSSDGTESGKE